MTARIRLAPLIRERLTMEDVLTRYGGDRVVRGRIRCFVHNGEDRNMRVYDKSAYCFVCGANETVLDYVMRRFGLTLSDAEKKLDEDFSLGLNTTKLTHAKRLELVKRQKEATAQRVISDAKRMVDDAILSATATLYRESRRLQSQFGPLSSEWCSLKEMELWAEVEFDALLHGRR